MNIIGIDFASNPSRRKPVTCLRCSFDGDRLRAEKLERWPDLSRFEEELKRPGPWIAGIDFPFGQARRFIETIEWPRDWLGYVRQAESLGREGFRHALDAYRAPRPDGDKEHRRKTDKAAGSVSPQKLYGVPVGLMFFEGAPRLAASGVTIPHLKDGDPDRIVVEAYPGVLARSIIQRQSYKHETRKKQSPDQKQARLGILEALVRGDTRERYGFGLEACKELCDDPAGDDLDALLCAVQAAWAWLNRSRGYGAPADVDPAEGWIADPIVSAKSPGDLPKMVPPPRLERGTSRSTILRSN